jgi:thiamine-phosphate pyrophosphorylase
MVYEFTPAAERAITVAARWRTSPAPEIDAPGMLLGLLDEPECRAALMLARHGVDADAVRSRWPGLAFYDAVAGEPRRFSTTVQAALSFAEDRLFEYPRPLELATEHLLLGLVGGAGEASAWLQERGLQPAEIEAEVHRVSGHTPGPLDWDDSPSHVQSGAMNAPATPCPSSRDEIGSLRIADAAANRAGEGLRVIEDYLRFVLDDRHLMGRAKSLRHELTDALAVFAQIDRHAARETQADVGTQISTPAEQTRASLESIVAASFNRVQQSLRSLEEMAKLVDSSAAARIEQLRYQTYTLERAVDITRTSLDRLADARLYVLVDGRESASDFRSFAETLDKAGVDVLQLRDKQLSDRELLGRAKLAREVTVGTRTLLIINDRPDIAALSQADGVHVGQEELSVKDARSIVGPRALIGVSTHSIEQARQAVIDGANYLGVGPTFPSQTKQFDVFPGLDLLRQVAAEISLPAFAIGGIDQSNIAQVVATGIRRVAVSGAINSSADPAAEVAKLRASVGAG